MRRRVKNLLFKLKLNFFFMLHYLHKCNLLFFSLNFYLFIFYIFFYYFSFVHAFCVAKVSKAKSFYFKLLYLIHFGCIFQATTRKSKKRKWKKKVWKFSYTQKVLCYLYKFMGIYGFFSYYFVDSIEFYYYYLGIEWFQGLSDRSEFIKTSGD